MCTVLLVFIIKIWVINTQRYETSAAYGALFYALNRCQSMNQPRAQIACAILKCDTVISTGEERLCITKVA